MLRTLAIGNYRSIRSLTIGLGRLNVVTGANGAGKSSLYRGLRLLVESAGGDLVAALAREGGLQSTFWAGPETIGRQVRAGKFPVQGTVRNGVPRLLLGFAGEDLGYAVDLGYPVASNYERDARSLFSLDPEIKREAIWTGPVFRRSHLLIDRRGGALLACDAAGNLNLLPGRLSGFESMMSAYADPRAAPEMIVLRERMRGWRFYDHLATGPDAPSRRPQVGTFTPVLAHDGADLAAALQTIVEIGDRAALHAAIEDAFPGSAVEIRTESGWFDVEMRQHGLLRPLRPAELSDGTLRYLMLTAALLTPRPPELLVLNEPETSLHPDLIAPLARLIASAAQRTQVLVVTHNPALARDLDTAPGCARLNLAKDFGETLLSPQQEDPPRWTWLDR